MVVPQFEQHVGFDRFVGDEEGADEDIGGFLAFIWTEFGATTAVGIETWSLNMDLAVSLVDCTDAAALVMVIGKKCGGCGCPLLVAVPPSSELRLRSKGGSGAALPPRRKSWRCSRFSIRSQSGSMRRAAE